MSKTTEEKKGLINLIKDIGEENIIVEPLLPRLTGAVTSKKGVTKLTFMTVQLTPGDIMTQEGKIGLVIWIPRDKWPH